jgi:hypothetical protein
MVPVEAGFTSQMINLVGNQLRHPHRDSSEHASKAFSCKLNSSLQE